MTTGTEPVLGDPASISALAATLRRTAGELEEALVSAAQAGSPSRRHTARLRALRTRGEKVTASMEHTGQRLADHAADLADSLGLARRIVERAESLGLGVDGPAITWPRGVHGLADAETEQTRAEALARLQWVLDSVLLDLDARRQGLRADLATERRCAASR